MTTDFGAMLYESLPGLYRDKDRDGQLRQFLELAAVSLGELEASVGQLYEDLFVVTSQEVLVPLIAGLVGAQVDDGQPTTVQRAQARDAVGFYRTKGMAEPLVAFAERLTGWRVTLVDFSERVARTPLIDSLFPVALRRDQPVAERPLGSGRFFMRTDVAARPLLDSRTGRIITREALAADPGAYAGAEGGFSVTNGGRDMFAGDGAFRAVAADLTDAAHPRTPEGAPLTIAPGELAVDPAIGCLGFTNPPLLAANVRVTFNELAEGSVPGQSLSIANRAVLGRLGRSDDTAPATIDLRAPRRPSERFGRDHPDNAGFFCTPAVVVADRRPSALPPDGATGCFSFSDRPLEDGDTFGVPLQLLDGLDGTPITRRDLAGNESMFLGTPRGFSIRVRGDDVLEADLPTAVRVIAANLVDAEHPKAVDGVTPLPLVAGDLAVDPELGRFRVEPAGLLAAEDLRVDYLTALATRVEAEPAAPLSDAVPEAWAFATGGEFVQLVDGVDGTPISTAVRLGRPLAGYHGTDRGWRVHRNGTPVEDQLAAERRDLDRLDVPVPPGTLRIDPDRGRLMFPPGFLSSGDAVTVSYSYEDDAELAVRFASLAQRFPRAVPAGVVPLLVDTRRTPVDPARLP